MSKLRPDFKVVCFLWHDPLSPTRNIYTYTADHVQSLKAQVAKHLTIPHEFVCVTNYADRTLRGIRQVPLDRRTFISGTRYVKLQLFSPEAQETIGRRILYLDLDTVVTRNINHLAERCEDLVLWANPNFGIPRRARFNTSIMLLTAGTRPDIWDEFVPGVTPQMLSKSWGGTDQAWISHKAKPDQPHWTDRDGIYGAGRLGDSDPDKCTELPENACIVFFPGRREPSMASVQQRHPWIKEHRL